MTVRFADAIAALPPRVQDRLAGPLSAVGLRDTEPVAFAGHARRRASAGCSSSPTASSSSPRRPAAWTARRWTASDKAVPHDTLLTVSPGEGGRLADDFRPLKPETFAGVEWPPALAAAHPGAGPRSADGGAGRIAALVVALLLVAAIVAAVLLLPLTRRTGPGK
jgi:hypothetical protein